MASRRRDQTGYGMGEPIAITRTDIWDPNSKSKQTRRNPLTEHPLFKGISPGAREQLETALKEITVNPGDRLTRHAIADGDNSPHNRLYLAGETPLSVDISTLSDDPENVPGKVLGRGVELDGTNFGSWFGGATGLSQVKPGLDVRASKGTPQRVHALPPLPKLFDYRNPRQGLLQKDVEILLANAGGIFSRLINADNQAEATGLNGFQAHKVPTLSAKELDELRALKGVRKDLKRSKGFAPNLEGRISVVSAFIIEGNGLFFDRGLIEARRLEEATPLELMDADIHPLARLGAPDGRTPAAAFVFQWAGLDLANNRAAALFYPTESGTTVSTIPIGDNLLLRHMAVRSIAEAAASMHEHVNSEAARLEAEQPLLKRLRGGLLRLLGQNT